MTEDTLTEIRKGLELKKAVYGIKQIVKNLKLGKIQKVFVSRNCPQNARSDVEYYSKLSNIPVIQLDIHNSELGTLCKKSYSISTLALLK